MGEWGGPDHHHGLGQTSNRLCPFLCWSPAYKEEDTRTSIHMDFGYITGKAESKDKPTPGTTFLCCVDSQTKWTLSIPVPSKDKVGLKSVVQQLMSSTAGMGDVCLIIRSDQEPALKQIARTWQTSRAAFRMKSEVPLVWVSIKDCWQKGTSRR